MAVLTTARLVLLPWEEGFLPELARLTSDERVVRFLGDGRVWSAELAARRHRAYLEHWDHHGFGWRGVLLRDRGDFVGVAALNHLTADVPGLDGSVVEIGWWVDPRVWGRGIATEAATATRDDALTRVGASRLAARFRPANRASERVMRKLGMRPYHEFVDEYGEWASVYTLTHEEWCVARAR